jgi:hypothetical protein
MKRLYKWMLAPLFMVLFFSCEHEDWRSSPIIEKEFNITGFAKIMASDVFNIVVTKGTNFSIKAKGPTVDVNQIQMYPENNTLKIKFTTQVNNRPRIDVFITMPFLVTVSLSGAAEGSATGFDGQTTVMRTLLSGASKFNVNGAANSTQLEISGASELTMTGTAAEISGNVSGGSKVAAYGLTTTYADVLASGGSTIRIKVEHTLYAGASGGSRIYYKGNPAEKHIEESGGGQVIQE